mmetsp:Transcript_29653/g.61848  ORF Transcript_29653/g.61848 Transcript_29653/m.61848 type:complete len:214 (-) Transcript_29653:520-1161(-)
MWTTTLSGLSSRSPGPPRLPPKKKGSFPEAFCLRYPRMMIVNKKTAIPTIREGQRGFSRFVPLCFDRLDEAAATLKSLSGPEATSPRSGAFVVDATASDWSLETCCCRSLAASSSAKTRAISSATPASPQGVAVLVGKSSAASADTRPSKAVVSSIAAATSRWFRKADRSFQAYPAANSSSRSLGTASSSEIVSKVFVMMLLRLVFVLLWRKE